jgi:hypothetical protein
MFERRQPARALAFFRANEWQSDRAGLQKVRPPLGFGIKSVEQAEMLPPAGRRLMFQH